MKTRGLVRNGVRGQVRHALAMGHGRSDTISACEEHYGALPKYSNRGSGVVLRAHRDADGLVLAARAAKLAHLGAKLPPAVAAAAAVAQRLPIAAPAERINVSPL